MSLFQNSDVISLDNFSVSETNFNDCIKINFSLDSDYNNVIKKGSGYFILARDIGIVKIYYKEDSGATINFYYISHEKTGMIKIDGNINCNNCNISDYTAQISNCDTWSQNHIDSNGNFHILLYGEEAAIVRFGQDKDSNGTFDDFNNIAYFYISCYDKSAYKSYGNLNVNVNVIDCNQYSGGYDYEDTVSLPNIKFKSSISFYNVKYDIDYPYKSSDNMYAIGVDFYIIGDNVSKDKFKVYVEYANDNGYGVSNYELGFLAKRFKNSEGFSVEHYGINSGEEHLIYYKTIYYSGNFSDFTLFNGKTFKIYAVTADNIKISNSELQITIPENGIKALELPQIAEIKGIIPSLKWKNVNNAKGYFLKVKDILIDSYYQRVFRKEKIFFTGLSNNAFDFRNVASMKIPSGKYSVEIYAYDSDIAIDSSNINTNFVNIATFKKLIDFKYPIPAKNIFSSGWHLLGAVKDYNIAEVKDTFPQLKTVWKWKDNSWAIWSPDTTVIEFVNNYGISLIEEIREGEGFWVNE